MLSIIIPAYNEEKRVKCFAESLIEYVNNNLAQKHKDYEIIFVNDGSKDDTLKILKSLKDLNKNKRKIKIISYSQNQGKGYAIKKGVLNAKGGKIIFIDADGSILPEEIPKMLEKLEKYDIVIGNRSSEESNIKQPFLRAFTGITFSKIANLIFPINTIDTLCGFKGFKRKAAVKLFREMISSGWIFDIELLYRAKKNKYTIYKLPFNWNHKEGTKIKIYTPLLMILDLIKLRFKILYGKKSYTHSTKNR